MVVRAGLNEVRVLKNWYFSTVGWRRLLRVSWTERRSNQSISREINPFGRTDAETETPVFWSPDTNSWLIGKVPDTGKDWQQKEKRASEDEMARWHHWSSGHELGQTSGNGEGQRCLECCSTWGHKELDTTVQLNTTNIPLYISIFFIHSSVDGHLGCFHVLTIVVVHLTLPYIALQWCL